MTEEEKPLFEPYLMNDLRLKNRVVMAPLTRSRAENIELEAAEIFTPPTTRSVAVSRFDHFVEGI